MKNVAASLLVLFFSMPLALSADAHVTLLYPAGGESFEPGAHIQISWRIDVPHNQENWDLYFSSDGGATWEAIALDLSVDQLTYDWVVPGIETTEARIRIVQDNAAVDYEDSCSDFAIGSVATALDTPPAGPETPALSAVYPNPFTTTTALDVTLPSRAHVVVEVFDVRGVKVATLIDEMRAAGNYRVRWTPTVQASGVYLCRLTVGTYTETKTALLVK